MKKKNSEPSIQYPIIFVLILLVVVSAVTAGYTAQKGSMEGSEKVVPGNYFNNEVRSGSQVLEVTIIP